MIREAASQSRGGAEAGGLLVGTASAHDHGVEVVVCEACLTPSSDRSVAHFTFDPAAVEEVIEDAAVKGLRVVGWCHTHPAGEPFMSSSDIRLHEAEFSAAWQISIVGSVALAGPLLGIWHLSDGLLEEVTEYETIVSRGLDDERRDALARGTGPAQGSSAFWTPPLLGAALALVDGAEPMAEALQTKFPGESSAERWRVAIASLASEQANALDPEVRSPPASEDAGLLDRVGLIAGGVPVVGHGLPLAGESDLGGGVLCALDKSRLGISLVFLEEKIAQHLVLPLDCFPWLDIAVADDDSAWLLSTKGEVVRLRGLRGSLDGHKLTVDVVDAVAADDDMSLRAAGDTCAILSGPPGRREMVLCGTDCEASTTISAEQLDTEIVTTWRDTFATGHHQLASRWTLRSAEGHDLATWAIPQELSQLNVKHVSILAPRVLLVCEDPSNGMGVVLELEVGMAGPVAFWLRSAGEPLGRAFPVAQNNSQVVYVDSDVALSLFPGCGG